MVHIASGSGGLVRLVTQPNGRRPVRARTPLLLPGSAPRYLPRLPPAPISLVPPSAPHTDSEAVARDAVERMRRAAEALRDLDGSGIENYGRGDPQLVERRRLVGQLAKQTLVPTPTDAWFVSDHAYLQRLETTDSLDVGVDDEAWTERRAATASLLRAVSSRAGGIDALDEAVRLLETDGLPWGPLQKALMAAETTLQEMPSGDARDATLGSVRARIDDYLWRMMDECFGKVRAMNEAEAEGGLAAIHSGATRFFQANPQTLSTEVLSRIQDPALRARTITDLLLQWRGAEDVGTKPARMFGGAEGIVSVVELRARAKEVEPNTTRHEAQLDYALTRLLAVSSPRSSTNNVMAARHAVSAVRRLVWPLVYGDGARVEPFGINPYEAIHHNFSSRTPDVIRRWLEDVVFGGGPAEVFEALVEAMNAPDESQARPALERLADHGTPLGRDVARLVGSPAGTLADHVERYLVERCRGPLDLDERVVGALSATEQENLAAGLAEGVEGHHREKLTACLALYRSVSDTTASTDGLRDELFDAHAAWPRVAEVVGLLDAGAPKTATLSAINQARAELSEAFAASPDGWRRLEMWRVDRKLELRTSSLLADLVTETGDMTSDEAKRDAMLGVRDAVNAASLSGLDAIAGKDLRTLARRLDRLIAKGRCADADYRAAMCDAARAIAAVIEGMREAFDKRVPDVSEGLLVPHPGFVDDLVKEGPLYYAYALAQKGRTVGLVQTNANDKLVNPPVDVLYSIGPTIFDRVVVAEDVSDLRDLGVTRRDLCFVHRMDDKKMSVAGAMISDFPAGYGHAAFFARGVFMGALSYREWSDRYEALAEALEGDRVYYDDSDGQVVITSVSEARRMGLLQPGDESKLEPGVNRDDRYLTWDGFAHDWRVYARHETTTAPSRPTRTVEIYGGAAEIEGVRGCPTFEELGPLGTAARGLGGEKTTVLAMMAVHPKLSKYVPPGSLISSERCWRLLDECGVKPEWDEVFDEDPNGPIDARNFLDSRLYTDADYRAETRQRMQQLVLEYLTGHLLDHMERPTAAGRELLAEIRRNPGLAKGPLIVRSSYGGEDRPFKSGAGQYDSFPDLRSDADVLYAVAGGLAAAWDAAPVENNVLEGFYLRAIPPALNVMQCLSPTISGVAVSRDTGTGHRRSVSYQLVEGFGGGVEDVGTAGTETGVLRAGKRGTAPTQILQSTLCERSDSALSPELRAELCEAVLEIERMFHRSVEPGMGYAVDVEWAVQDERLYIVQARTVQM